jgi:hypothetical protein
MKKELIINQQLLAAEFLNSAIENVQKQVLLLDKAGTKVDPAYALTELQAALNHAALLANDLAAKNFEVEEILTQRKAIRRQLRAEGLA